MKFLIYGIGSIGQRHYRNLQRLGHEVAIFRSGKNPGYNKVFIEAFLEEQRLAGRPSKAFHDFTEALEVFNPDAVFVTNPNSCHMEVALPAAEAAKHLFIEKPVSNTLAGLDRLEDLVKEHSLIVMVGYNLRFHPLLGKMHDLCASGAIGKPLAAHVESGENIEDWHPWEDYRQSYAAYQAGGGGVVLCFSHDIDYLYWFFGKPRRVFALGGKLTPLAGDAEDMMKALLEFPDGVATTLHLDCWQRPPRRVFEIIGTAGKLCWDYYAGTLIFLSRSGPPETFTLPPGFDRNDMFVAEVKAFTQAMKERRDPPIPLRQGREVLEVALEIKKYLAR